MDGLGRVLLTQRTWAMRTFPGCWVFPGGGVDSGEDLATAARRELLEETGLTAGAMEIFCLWESVYPTSSKACEEAGKIAGHALTAFMEAVVAPEPIELQCSECAAYVWAPLKDLMTLEPPLERPLLGRRFEAGELKDYEVSAMQLQGIYPNCLQEGMGQGHLYALKKLAERRTRPSL